MNMLAQFSFRKSLGFILLVLITLWMSLDGQHYWHEIRFLYASTQFSLKEILSGQFNPHQIGGTINEISSSGFYLAKVLHLSLLQLLYKVIPAVEGGFTLSRWLSVICMGISTIMCFSIFSRLLKSKRQAWLAACCFLLVPITPYLAGKILSEVTALLLVAISIWALAASLDSHRFHSAWMTFASGVFLLLATLARLDIVLCFLGFYGAFVVTMEEKLNKIKILKAGGVIAAIFLVGYVGTVYSLGLKLEALIQYFTSFTSAGTKSIVISILGIFTFGGILYGLSVAAIFHQERRKVLFLSIWFLLSAGSAILITKNYMVEPRYLIHGVFPLSGLGGLGLDVLWQKIQQLPFKHLIVTIFFAAILVFNGFAVRLMPYELNQPSILRAVSQILELDETSTILIPWSYTDFHFLRVMQPSVPILNVNSPSQDGHLLPLKQTHRERLEKWYGESYISTSADLSSLLADGSVYYLGWRNYPPVDHARNILQVLRSRKLMSLIDGIPFKNHLAESWIWHSPAYNLDHVGTCGQYEYYKVTLN